MANTGCLSREHTMLHCHIQRSSPSSSSLSITNILFSVEHTSQFQTTGSWTVNNLDVDVLLTPVKLAASSRMQDFQNLSLPLALFPHFYVQPNRNLMEFEVLAFLIHDRTIGVWCRANEARFRLSLCKQDRERGYRSSNL